MPICRLLAPAQIDGTQREPGYVFTLADGALGPHTTVIKKHDRIDLSRDSVRIGAEYEDVPLYELVDESKG